LPGPYPYVDHVLSADAAHFEATVRLVELVEVEY